MYYIPVCGMKAYYTCAGIMHASYYNACIDDYAMLLTYIYMQFTKLIFR